MTPRFANPGLSRSMALAGLYSLALGPSCTGPEQRESSPAPSSEGTPASRADSRLSGPLDTKDAPDTPALAVSARVLLGRRVRLEIATTIPGTIEVMAGLSLAGQDPDDVFIGTNTRVTIQNGKGEVDLDSSRLPPGTYDAEVSFHPRWGFKNDEARRSGISEIIETTTPILLTGDGESSNTVVLRKNGQKWVMLNIVAGTRWDSGEWKRRFGASREVSVDRYDSRIIKGYYFPSIDVTVLVNTLKGEVLVWRLGRATH